MSDMTVRLLMGGVLGAAIGLMIWYVRSRKAPARKLNPLREMIAMALVGGALAAVIGPSAGGGLKAVDHLPSITTPEEFQQQVIDANTPVVVDFYSPTCGPCHRLAPTIAALAEDYKGRAAFVKVDVTEAPEVTKSHQLRRVPTIVIYDKGREVARLVGGKREKAYREALDPLVNSPPQPAG